jgi:acyl-CoA thioesterase I
MTARSWFRVATATALLLAGGSHARAAIKVACVGDSITVGARSSTPAQTYPSQLGARLGAGYTVGNFGVGGTTLLHNGDSPYVGAGQYGPSGAFAPDLVVIMLGTNDSKPANWSKRAAFDADYKALIAHYAELPSKPRVFVALPTPVFGTNPYDISAANLTDGVVPAVRKVAIDTGMPIIDLYAALMGEGANFPDNVHPNDAGNTKIADTVFRALIAVSPPPDAGSDAPAGDGGGNEVGPVAADALPAVDTPAAADVPPASADVAMPVADAGAAEIGNPGTGGAVVAPPPGGSGAASSGGCAVAGGEWSRGFRSTAAGFSLLLLALAGAFVRRGRRHPG